MGLFDEQIARKPNHYPWTQDFIDAMWKGFWTSNDFSFAADYQHFQQLPQTERDLYVRLIAAIGQIEIAPKSFWLKIGEVLPHPAIHDLGIVLGHSEVIHNIAYEKPLERLGLNEVFQQNLLNPIMKGRVDYLRKYAKRSFADDRKQFVYALILFTLFVENVSLFSQFYAIRWLHKFHTIEKLFPDTAQQVQYTRLEEMLHAQVGITIINTLRREYPELFDAELEARVREEIGAALVAESNVIDWIIGDYETTGVDPDNENRVHTLNAAVLKGYVGKRMSESMLAIGFEAPPVDPSTIAETAWFDREVILNMHTDFFAMKPVDYQKRAVAAGDLF